MDPNYDPDTKEIQNTESYYGKDGGYKEKEKMTKFKFCAEMHNNSRGAHNTNSETFLWMTRRTI
jgi:hypothetical protein